MIGSLMSRMADAEKLSVAQLHKAVQDGTVPAYVGIPLIQDKLNQQKEAQGMQGAQQKPPPIAQQVMAAASQHGIDEAQSNLYPQETGAPSHGIDEAQSNLPTQQMAGGGIVAFASGDLVDDETDDEEDDSTEERRLAAETQSLFNEAASRVGQGIEAGHGIGSLVPTEKESKKIAYSISPDVKNNIGFKDKIEHIESRGRDYDEKGNVLTSSKGAMGRMQTMPNTLRDPGFGVKPAQGNHPEEMARVGRDYADAMLARYKDPKIAAIAYNMGPGATDKWLMAGADMSQLPGETRKYQSHFAEGGIASIKHYANNGLVEDGSGGYSELGIPIITPPSMGNLAAATPGSREFLGLPPIKETPKKETKSTKHEDMVKDLPPAGPLTQGTPPSSLGIDSVVTPKEPSFEDKYLELLKGREATSAKQRSVDNYMALLQAGLGIMGGTSPYAAVNIGQGASMGVAAKMAAEKNRIAEENATMKGYGNLYTAQQNAEMRKTLAGQGQEAAQRKAAGQQLLGLEQKTKQNYMTQFGRTMIGASPEDITAAADKAAMADLAKNDTYKNMFKVYNGYDYAAPAMAPTVVDYSKTYGLTPKSK